MSKGEGKLWNSQKGINLLPYYWASNSVEQCGHEF